jgi:ABC-type amino acid transport substrate-binding protein
MFVFVSKAKTLDVIFEHNPPFQMVDENGVGYGPVYDFAKLLVKHANLSARFTAKPWARIMEKDSKLPNTLILSMSKTPQRKEHFVWLTSVYIGQQYLWKNRNSVDPANNNLHASMERNSHKAKSINDYFKAENVFEFLNSTQALNALIKGRVHRFVGTTFAVSGKLASLGYDLDILERLSAFDESGFASQGLYLTLTLETDDTINMALQKALKNTEVIKARNKLFDSFKLAEKALINTKVNDKQT